MAMAMVSLMSIREILSFEKFKSLVAIDVVRHWAHL